MTKFSETESHFNETELILDDLMLNIVLYCHVFRYASESVLLNFRIQNVTQQDNNDFGFVFSMRKHFAEGFFILHSHITFNYVGKYLGR